MSNSGGTFTQYFDFTADLTGYQNPIVSFESRRSPTGARIIEFAYSTTGVTGPFIPLAYNGVNPEDTFVPSSFNLVSITAVDNNPNVVFRVLVAGAIVPTGGQFPGTYRLDNFIVQANQLPTGYTYLWSDSQTNTTATGLTAGTYTVVFV